MKARFIDGTLHIEVEDDRIISLTRYSYCFTSIDIHNMTDEDIATLKEILDKWEGIQKCL